MSVVFAKTDSALLTAKKTVPITLHSWQKKALIFRDEFAGVGIIVRK